MHCIASFWKEKSSSKYVDLIHKKLSNLQDENSLLRTELSSLSEQTEQIEKHEQKLTTDCIHQLNDAQERLRELQAEVDRKGIDLIKCQEECSSVIQQLVSGQQKMKELTIENLDMKETIKTSNDIQQELTSETANYVRKLSSKPPSLSSSMTSNSGRARKPTGKNLLNSLPIPGSPITKPSANHVSANPTNVNSLTKPSRPTTASASAPFFDEIERHRQNLGRPGIPGSKDLDAALKRLSLRRQNEESERGYKERERHNSGLSQPSTISVNSSQQQDSRECSGTSTPTARSPSPESELSGYGSASSFGYRMPEKLQIVKPMEGSATLHHWQRLATPHLAGLFEQRHGVQIKHGQPLNDLDSDTYSLMDVEEEVVPVRPSGRAMMTNTVTDARVMHPSTTSYPYLSPMTVSSTMSTVTSLTSSGSASSSAARLTTSGRMSNATSTFSISLGLASILSERGISGIGDSGGTFNNTAPKRFGCLTTESTPKHVHTKQESINPAVTTFSSI
ncbi:milt [Bugula neritina]|uniref:Milt n=1 Tax=Bugula neritina TaxID=10212 RepID=A0A7J7JU16_BUGNE|nr:milt [Bugula neritina]